MFKINIITPIIDEKILIDALDKLDHYNETINYIIVNNWTYNKIFKTKLWYECWNKKGLSYTAIRDIPVAICNKLIDGEVELV